MAMPKTANWRLCNDLLSRRERHPHGPAKEFGDLPWKPVTTAIKDLVMRFEPTERPVLAAVRLDLAVMDLRLRLAGVARLPAPEIVQ